MNNIVKAQNSRDRTSLRLEAELIAMIDKSRVKRVGVVSRNTWIAEAIQEKLSREIQNAVEKQAQIDQFGD